MLSTARAVGQTMGIAALGAFWAARVIFHSGGGAGSAAQAPVDIQVLAMNEMTLFAIAAVAVALALAIWDYIASRETQAVSSRLG